jgi:NAD(P)H-flavin reductase
VLSEEPDGSEWQGQRGFVTELIPEMAANSTQTYMCGPPPMLDAAEAVLNELNLSPDGIFCDRFLDRSSII